MQLAPAHATLQLAPHEPVQVALRPQFKRQPEVLSLQALNPQVCPGGHSQEVPLQNWGAQAVNTADAANAKSGTKIEVNFMRRIYRPVTKIATSMTGKRSPSVDSTPAEPCER